MLGRDSGGTWRRRSALLAGALGGLALALPTLTSAASSGGSVGSRFDRAAAVRHADRWACADCYPPVPFQRFSDNDCAAFVSQAWLAGGIRPSPEWFVKDCPSCNQGRHRSVAWVNPRAFAYWARQSGLVEVFTTDLTSNYNAASPGDAILYDWGEGAGYSHLAIEVGWDASGDYIDQHTTDRFHSPWNWGWQLARSGRLPAAQHQRALVLHIRDGQPLRNGPGFAQGVTPSKAAAVAAASMDAG